MQRMVIRVRARFAVSALAGVAIFIGSLTGLRAGQSYEPVFGSCAPSTDLTIAAGTDTSVNQQRQQLIDQWNAGARGQDRRARIVEISSIADLRHSQLMAAEQSGSCGYDILMLDVIWTAEFASDGFIRAIPSGDLSNGNGFYPSALQTGQWKGRQYAVPFSSNVGLLYYRAGTAPPATWDGLVDRGYAGQFRDYEGLTVNALEAIWNDGGPGVLTGTSTHLTPKTVRTKILPALTRIAIAARHRTNPLLASRTFDEQGSQDAFANSQAPGQPAFMRNWPDAYRTLAADPRQWRGAALTFGVAPLPGGYSALGGDNLAIATASRQPMNQVLDLINFLTSQSSEDKLFACAGIVPSRLFVLESPGGCPQEAHAASSDAELGHALSQAQNSQFTHQLDTALSHALPRPVTPHYAAFSATFRGCVEKVLDGSPPSPEDFAGAVNAALDGRGTFPSCRV